MNPYYADDRVTLYGGDALAVLASLPDASVDAVITDPPYGLADLPPATVAKALAAWLSGDREHVPDGRGFMGREWDKFVPPPAVWDECARVLKPGGHLLAFAAPRTADLMGLSIRLAGLEVRDSLHWIYGSGFLTSPRVMTCRRRSTRQPGLSARSVAAIRHRAIMTTRHGSQAASWGARPMCKMRTRRR